MAQDESNQQGFFRRHGAATVAGVAAVVAVVVASFFLHIGDQPPPRKVQNLQIVSITPPPPPPPPPPKEIPQPKMIEQPTIKEPEAKPDKPMDKPKDAPPRPVEAPPTGPLSTSIKADGPDDGYALAGSGSGNGLLGGGGGGGSRFGWYASMVQTQIEEALRDNKKTRNARLLMELRVWADAEGRVERVQLVASSGSAELDDAVSREVLPGLKLREPPPKDMPMPIVMRATARRPG